MPTRGHRPSWTLWRAREKAPEMTALRRDDRSDGRKNDEGNDGPGRREPEKEIFRLIRMRKKMRALTDVAQKKRRIYEKKP